MAKKKKNRNSLKFVFYLPIFVVIAYLIFSLVSARISVKKIEAELKEIENQVKEQTLINEELKKELERSESDEYIEKKAREKGMVYPDEKIYMPR